jgi:hypothetical protein
MSIFHRERFVFLFVVVIVAILIVLSFKHINNVFAKNFEPAFNYPTGIDLDQFEFGDENDNENEQEEKTKNHMTKSSSGYNYICANDVGSALGSNNKVAGKFLDESNSKSQMSHDCSPSKSLEEVVEESSNVDEAIDRVEKEPEQIIAVPHMTTTNSNVAMCINQQTLDGTMVKSFSKNIETGTNPNRNECNNRVVSNSNENLIISKSKSTEISATEQDGVIIGTSGPDVVYGKDHDDIIQSREGTDTLYGGKGDDSLQGGTSPDTLLGEDGNDVITGGSEDDYLNGGNRNDLIYASSGDDVLEGGPGQDYFNCGDDVDIVLDFSKAEGDIITSNCEDVQRDDS